MLGFFGGVGGI